MMDAADLRVALGECGERHVKRDWTVLLLLLLLLLLMMMMMRWRQGEVVAGVGGYKKDLGGACGRVGYEVDVDMVPKMGVFWENTCRKMDQVRDE